LLLRAAREGKLLYQDGARLDDFLDGSEDAASSTKLDELDERMD